MKAKPTKKLTHFGKNIRRHIALAFIPHKANQYRPRLIRRYGLVAVALVIAILHVGYNFSTTGTVLGEKALVTPDTLLASTNKTRVHRQLQPLQLDSKLSRAAFLKAQDMFEGQYWAHTAPDGVTPWQWFGDVDYNYAYAGENLAKNFRTSNAVLMAWMASPEHEANVVNQYYSDVGFAVVDGMLDGKNTTIIVALYGAPANGGVAGVQAAGAASEGRPMGVITQLGVAIQSMSPAVIGSVMLMLVVMGVALLAHFYRNKLPKQLYNSWYRHHGVAKASGVMVLCLIIIVLYSGGQI